MKVPGNEVKLLRIMGEHPKTLEEIADEQFVAAINSAFRMGARACREMMARFVEQGPPTDPKTLAGSIRANWSPHWGDDAGPPDEYPVELGALEARVDAEKFAASAVAKALTMLDDEPMTTPAPDEICEELAVIAARPDTSPLNRDMMLDAKATIERLCAALEEARDYLRDEGRHTAMDQIRTLDMIDAALGKDASNE